MKKKIRVKFARPIGRYRNPDSTRPVRVFVGMNSRTGEGVRFYESKDERIFINPSEFRFWTRFSA